MGAGNTKNRRGAGGRGGRGKAGTNKHRFHTAGRLKPRRYKQKIMSKKGKEINLTDLNAKLDLLVINGKVKKEGDKYIVDKYSGIAKVLSEGEVTKKIILRVNASEKAIAKIIKAGGKFEYAKKDYTPEEVTSEEDEELEFESAEGEVEEK